LTFVNPKQNFSRRKTMNKKITWILVLALLLVGVVVVAAQGLESTPVSDGGITPYIITGDNPGGNRTCEEVGAAFFGDANYYQYTSGKVDYEGGAFLFEPGEGWPAGLTVTTDGTYVSFESTFAIGAVIVKGRNDANVYVYDPQEKSDSGLASPPNASSESAGLSNLTFCWNPENGECEWIGETAWAAGSRYVNRGNWATYTPYVADSTVILYAGQTMEAGTVHFSAVDGDGNILITITLNAGWQLEDVYESVKIQGYNTAPSGNPAPGLFTTYKGEELSVTVPAYNFYGVHLNVEWERCQ
jgi:hypothetical protein